ncbi:MAG: hypothetical protein NW206_09425, partial [Hyphomonadaceae bacterium]|nr:hypothetical protein [Hyphomonadaceae bacterium]
MTVNDALIIRHAVDADLEALVDLKWEMNTAEHAALPPGSFIAPMLDLSREAAARAIDAHWRSQSDQRGAWFVGERAGAVIASTRWTELALGPSFKPARVGLLATVVVAASARGRGY